MKLPPLLALPAALACLLTAPLAHAADTPLKLERYLYDDTGELVPTPVSVLDYAEASVCYRDGVRRYRHGDGKPIDWSDAFKSFLKAAQAGHAEAAFYVGRMYYYGDGIERDYALAEHWYQLAARNGSARAYNNLGYMEDNGKGREKNPLKAREYYETSSGMGFSMASYNLAQLYHSGDEGIPADRDKAFAYLQLALVQYDYLNNDVLNEMADWIIDDPDQSDPVLIEQSLRLAEFLVANGDHEAMRTLGYYYNRQDDDFSRQQAYKYFLMLAQRQNVDGMVRVAAKLHKGDGVGRDPEGSLRWYRNALDKAPLNRYANYMIGLAYYDAEVVEQDYPTAIRYFRTGLEQGNDGPAEYLGWLYRKGLGCEQDDVQAYAYYLLAGDTLSGGSRDTMANIAAELSPEQLQRAEAIARDFRSQYWDEEQD